MIYQDHCAQLTNTLSSIGWSIESRCTEREKRSRTLSSSWLRETSELGLFYVLQRRERTSAKCLGTLLFSQSRFIRVDVFEKGTAVKETMRIALLEKRSALFHFILSSQFSSERVFLAPDEIPVARFSRLVPLTTRARFCFILLCESGEHVSVAQRDAQLIALLVCLDSDTFCIMMLLRN